MNPITLPGIGPRRRTLRGVAPDPNPLPPPLLLEASWDDESNIRENGFSLTEILWFQKGTRGGSAPVLFVTSESFRVPFTLGELIDVNADAPLPHELIHSLRMLRAGEQYRYNGGANGVTVFTRVQ